MDDDRLVDVNGSPDTLCSHGRGNFDDDRQVQGSSHRRHETLGIGQGLLGEVAWVLVFIVLSRWLYRLGLRRYSAYGG